MSLNACRGKIVRTEIKNTAVLNLLILEKVWVLIFRWYEETGLAEKLSFARHRLAECFLWSMGFIPETHLGYAREIMTKLAVMITITDDIYDLYGTLEELQVFTETVERCDDHMYLLCCWDEV